MKAVKRDYWPTHEWQIANPNAVGLNKLKLQELDHLIKSQYKNTNGIVVVKNGAIVFEKYYNNYSSIDTHNVASVTKSFISALIGIAIEKGFIDNVDQKVLSFFPEYTANADDIIKRSITLKHLLTMTTPFALTRGMYEPLDRLRRQRDWVKYILNNMGRKGRLGSFQYSTSGTHLLSAIITRTTGKCAREFANEYLFKPLGMRVIPNNEIKSFSLDEVFGKDLKGWVKDPQGNTVGGWGLTITPRDMARFGYLYLNKGNWNGIQIIAESWITKSLIPHSETKIDNSIVKYGYLWWLREENNISMHLAIGHGCNIICCIPEKDMVIAIASKIIKKTKDPFEFINKILTTIKN